MSAITAISVSAALRMSTGIAIAGDSVAPAALAASGFSVMLPVVDAP